MKANLYITILIFILLFYASRVEGQYHIVYTDVQAISDTINCGRYRVNVGVNSSVGTLSVKTWFGDGTYAVSGVASGTSIKMHRYITNGMYTLKHVLYDGVTAIDSVINKRFLAGCSRFIIGSYIDLDNDCFFDSTTEAQATVPLKVEVSTGGIPIDTITTTGSIRYNPENPDDTVCSFRPLPLSGVSISCPPGGIITDTFGVSAKDRNKAFGITCAGSSSGFDIAAYVSAQAGVHAFISRIIVGNTYCSPQNVILTMHFSSKYHFLTAAPLPQSVSGNTITWVLSGVSAVHQPYIIVSLDGAHLAFGDTIHSDYTVTPITGDINPVNNAIIRVDTVRAGFDPNAKEVSPQGDITAGAKLTYTIHFENMGNDTAFNIHVLDTLSDKLDLNSLEILSASAVMDFSVVKNPWFNIVKFDFPNINLLDTSHHGLNTGMFVYTINAKAGLPNGTVIKNRAGIYFDYNEVVLTNTVQNQITFPAAVQTMSNTAKPEIYPNPVTTELTINTSSSSFNAITITNTIGQVMQKQTLNGAQTKVDVRPLPAGLYFLTLKGEGGVKVQQFQKL